MTIVDTCADGLVLRPLSSADAAEYHTVVQRNAAHLTRHGDYGLGFWLSEHVTGRGLATAAVSALLAYAAERLGATDVLAGVTHGNEHSVALLDGSGFGRPRASTTTRVTEDDSHVEAEPVPRD